MVSVPNIKLVANIQIKENSVNRKLRRQMEKKLGFKKVRDIRKNMKNYVPLHDGDKVKIKVDEIINRIEETQAQYVQQYLDWIKENKDKVFTVEYDESHPNGLMVCLAEDTTPIKWLFWEGDLEKVKTHD